MATSTEAALAADKAPITVTEAAAAELQRAMEAQGKQGLALRIAVLPGGCAGMQYGLSLDSEEQLGDEEFESGGIRLVIGRQDLPLVMGMQVDYVQSVSGSGFKVENPNASESCGCGSSFSC
ncbi:MAG: iron-sulfur cluster assembly accessory protein [Candidatus Poseidoniia archaeon]|jgi:iron-sulfur cluster assembly protein|nr:iron-sulfur cluster assembly accessory protein [Candidatus Poseidoniia archaeon]|tara:strand:- start:3993 stop:4358 length:366 start_codon:yes stop_codon:yes gene_type:complete